MKRAQRAAFIVGSLCAGVLVATGIPAQAAPATAPDWQIVATVHYGPGGNASGYSAVVALTRSEAWVFGGTNPGGASSPTAEHWDGRRWQPSPLPSGLSDFIVAADASSARNVWAVGDGYALRWDGSRWSVAKTWPQAGQLTSVAAVNRNDVWVAMTPAASVSGMLFAHPAARYFTVGRIGKDQAADYASRRRLPLQAVERWLRPNLAYDPD